MALMMFVLPATVRSFGSYVVWSLCAVGASALLGFAAAVLRSRRERGRGSLGSSLRVPSR